jgi:hypothetical protein
MKLYIANDEDQIVSLKNQVEDLEDEIERNITIIKTLRDSLQEERDYRAEERLIYSREKQYLALALDLLREYARLTAAMFEKRMSSTMILGKYTSLSKKVTAILEECSK